MSERKRIWVTRLHRYLVNPLSLRLARFVPGQAVVETTGRNSGLPRRTPVGGKVEDGCFWLVSEHGRRAQYVRNILADPRVRVQLRGRWYSGTAELRPDDDPVQRLRRLPGYNSAGVRLLATDPLTVKIVLSGSETAR